MSDQLEHSPDVRERELFLGASEISDREERVAYLEKACQGDQALKQRVRDLLREEDRVGDFLQTPALSDPRGAASENQGFGPGGTEIAGLLSEKVGDRIGRYKLLQQIGEGGCGVVYMAEQEEPVRRRVALKVIKLGMDTKSVIARFEAERQALALMEHPNIAKVLDAGATDTGRPYFVMELVRGVKITEYCDQHNLATEDRLQLFVQVCQAIQHAHQKGIIHRDIKPSNILVTLHDGVPVPKVIDFGIVKATEQRLTAKTLFTEFAAFIGTPAYMSPEQAEMSGLDIDTRSDIYALGVLLYELLTGKTPFDPEALLRGGLDECRRTIREKEPLRPSTRLETMLHAELATTAEQRRTEAPKLIHSLRGDLDWVVMKCLEKDRTRRYDTANGVAMDVQRYLHDEPVLACPPSNVYRMRKLLRRHRGVVMATGSIAAALLAGATVSTWQAVRATRAEHDAYAAQHKESGLRQQAERERQRAEEETSLAKLNAYVADINLAQRALSTDGNYGQAIQLLNFHRPTEGEPDLRGFEWRYLWNLGKGNEFMALPDQDGPVHALALSPDGKWLAIGLRQELSIWNMQTRSVVTKLAVGRTPLAPFGSRGRGERRMQDPRGSIAASFSPDSSLLITGSLDSVRIWRTADWSEQAVLPGASGALALSKDGSRLVTEGERQFFFPIGGGMGRGEGRGDSGSLHVWDAKTWKLIRTIPGASGPLAISSDGSQVAGQTPAGLGVWAVEGNAAEVLLRNSTNLFAHPGPLSHGDRLIAFAPDGRSIVAARNNISEHGVFVLSIWDCQTGVELESMPNDPEHVEHTGVISSLAFSPDGSRLATASWDRSIRLWDVEKRQRIATLHGHMNEVLSLAFAADGQSLITGARDGSVKIWKTAPPKEDILTGPWEPLFFSPDGRRLAALSGQSSVVFLNLVTGQPEEEFILGSRHEGFGFRRPPPGIGPGPGHLPVALSADLGTLVQGLNDGYVRFLNTKTGESNMLKVAQGHVDLVALSPDGNLLVAGGGFGQSLRWIDLRTGTNGILHGASFKVWFSPDSRTLASPQREGGKESGIQLWQIEAGQVRTKAVIETPGSTVAFSPDSQLLATAAGPEDLDNVIHLWDAQTGKARGVLTGHKQLIWSLAFSPDGKTLASASDDGTLRLWNVATRRELLSIRRLGVGLRGLAFSPDGQLLVAGSGLFSQRGALQFFRAPLLSDSGAGLSEKVSGRTSP
jgi:WD40 repeat protein/serine/threonine protein kinase